MRAELIGHFQPCVTDIYLHIDARMADYIRTHPYPSLAAAIIISHREVSPVAIFRTRHRKFLLARDEQRLCAD